MLLPQQHSDEGEQVPAHTQVTKPATVWRGQSCSWRQDARIQVLPVSLTNPKNVLTTVTTPGNDKPTSEDRYRDPDLVYKNFPF